MTCALIYLQKQGDMIEGTAERGGNKNARQGAPIRKEPFGVQIMSRSSVTQTYMPEIS